MKFSKNEKIIKSKNLIFLIFSNWLLIKEGSLILFRVNIYGIIFTFDIPILINEIFHRI